MRKAITLTLLLTGVPFPVVATPDHPACYMHSENGQVVNLEGLCNSRYQELSASLSAQDQQFLEDYKNALKDSPEGQAALSLASPQPLIQQAKAICNALETGTFVEYRIAQIANIAGDGNPQNMTIANLQARTVQTLAPKAYCPGFDN
jgi:hypothetical protein